MGQDQAFDPLTYLSDIRAEIPAYEELQTQTLIATSDIAGHRCLELGVGTGETAQRLLRLHPKATLVGLDESEAMLKIAAERSPEGDFRVGRLQDPLPQGPFDLVVSALAVHHLRAREKADLFRRVRHVLHESGRFVVADLVVPLDSNDVVTEIDGEYDVPSTVYEQLIWLRQAGFVARVAWQHKDLAVLVATPSA
jgi:tRNA (cmo5U34)-methyltransferase